MRKKTFGITPNDDKELHWKILKDNSSTNPFDGISFNRHINLAVAEYVEKYFMKQVKKAI
jgi:hypothetical protein